MPQCPVRPAGGGRRARGRVQSPKRPGQTGCLRCATAPQPRTEEIAMELRLDGRSALITGGSKGLGLAMAVKFAAAGADVAILARNAGGLEEAKAEIKPSAKAKIAAVAC